MGLLYTRTENKNQISYKRKDKIFRIYWMSLVPSFIVIFVALGFENDKTALYFFIISVIIFIIGLPDALSIASDKTEARSLGKKVAEKGGGLLLGPSEITLEK